MAARTLFGTNGTFGTTPKYQELSETSPGANATSSPNVGWTVGTNAPTVYKPMGAAEERSAAGWSGTAKPTAASLATESNSAFRSKEKYKGKFAAGPWVFHFPVRAVTAGEDQDGAIMVRVYRSKNADGSSATEITGAALTGSTVTNLSTSADQDSTITWEPGAIELNEEYLFFDVAWKITGVGGGATRDVIFRWGDTGTRVVTPDFPADKFSEQVVADSPRLWLRHDEASGTVAVDSSGKSHPGTYKNTPTLGVAGALAGNAAVKYESASKEFAEVPDHADLDLADVFTIEAVVKREKGGVNQTIVCKGSGAYQLRIEEEGNQLQLLKQGTSITSYGPVVPEDGKFHHVVATKNGSTVTLWVDGKESHSGGTPSTYTDTATVLRVAATAENSEQFNGVIDEVAVYATALSEARIKAHYEAAIPAGETYNDSGSGTITLSGSKTASHEVSDARSGTATLSGSATQSYTATDSRSGTATLSGSSTQSYEASDSRSGTVTSSGSATETFQFIDSRSGTTTLSGSAAESAEGADSSIGELVFTASASESFEVDDAAEGAISFDGASDEDWSATESGSGSIAVGGVAEDESWGFTGSATGTLVLEGVGDEAWGFTASGEGTITFSGTGLEGWGFSRAQLADPPTYLTLAGKTTALPLRPKERTLTAAGRESALPLHDRESELELDG
jgi:Concanavalin A-like lectin/glucanases superfamily